MNVSGAPGVMPVPPATGSGFFASSTSAPSAAEAEFLKRARMSPAEQMRASILDSMGLKEEDLKSMSPEERKKIESRIEEMIKTKVEQDEARKGVLVDMKV